jgi:hypothetical protein
MPGLYENINKRKKAGTSRPKSKSTIDEKTYQKMKKKQDGFFAGRMTPPKDSE